jgi:hypothetical protein
VFELASTFGIEPKEQQVQDEVARFSQRHRLDTPEAASDWLAANHLGEKEFLELMKQLACCRAMHGWFRTVIWMQRTTKLVLDELRLDGRYPQAAARAAAREELVDSKLAEGHVPSARQPLAQLLAEHAEWTGRTTPSDPVAWLDEVGFHTEGNLRMELGRARIARAAIVELLASVSEPTQAARAVEGVRASEESGASA